MTLWRALGIAGVGLCVVGGPATASERDGASPYCRRVRAEASSTASLLFAPRLEAQLLRFPGEVDILGGEVPIPLQDPEEENPLQARALLAYSPVDFFRGRKVLAAADAECERHLARERLQRTVRQGASIGQVPALKKQVAFLEAQLPRVETLVSTAELGLERHLFTLVEVDELRLRRLRLQRQLADARQELAKLEELEREEPTSFSLRQELERYERATLEMERSRSALRKLEAWELDLRVGAVPVPALDWLALATFSFNFGSIPQLFAENRYLEARQSELESDDLELRTQVERLQRWAQTNVAQLREELELVNRQLKLRREQAAALESQKSERHQQRLALAELEQIELEAQKVELEQLLAAREALDG